MTKGNFYNISETSIIKKKEIIGYLELHNNKDNTFTNQMVLV